MTATSWQLPRRQVRLIPANNDQTINSPIGRPQCPPERNIAQKKVNIFSLVLLGLAPFLGFFHRRIVILLFIQIYLKNSLIFAKLSLYNICPKFYAIFGNDSLSYHNLSSQLIEAIGCHQLSLRVSELLYRNHFVQGVPEKEVSFEKQHGQLVPLS